MEASPRTRPFPGDWHVNHGRLPPHTGYNNGLTFIITRKEASTDTKNEHGRANDLRGRGLKVLKSMATSAHCRVCTWLLNVTWRNTGTFLFTYCCVTFRGEGSEMAVYYPRDPSGVYVKRGKTSWFLGWFYLQFVTSVFSAVVSFTVRPRYLCITLTKISPCPYFRPVSSVCNRDKTTWYYVWF